MGLKFCLPFPKVGVPFSLDLSYFPARHNGSLGMLGEMLKKELLHLHFR